MLQRALLVVTPPEHSASARGEDMHALASDLDAISSDYLGPRWLRPFFWICDQALAREASRILYALPARFIVQTPGGEREVSAAGALASPARSVHSRDSIHCPSLFGLATRDEAALLRKAGVVGYFHTHPPGVRDALAFSQPDANMAARLKHHLRRKRFLMWLGVEGRGDLRAMV